MARYSVAFTAGARRQFEAIPDSPRRRVSRAIDALAGDPRPRGAQMLAGGHGEWRIRIGDYRVLYEIGDDTLLVLVVRVGHRREVYRGRRVSEAPAAYGPAQAATVHGRRSWTREALANDG